MIPIKITDIFKLSVVFILLFVIYAMYLHTKSLSLQRDEALNKVTVLSEKIQFQNDAVNKLEEQTTMYQQRFEEIERQAKVAYIESNKKIQELMKANVPHDCEGAMKWGIDQALVF